MKKFITLSLIFISIIGLLFGATFSYAKTSGVDADSMQTANQLYENGQFAQAAQAYQQLADQGVSDSNLYYNLGNAYYKLGDYGRAILNYRRAQQLDPRDTDIAANLELARAQVVGEGEAPVENDGVLNKVAGFSQKWFTVNELALLALGAWVALVALIILIQEIHQGGLREAMQIALAAFALVLVLSGAALGSRLYLQIKQPQGVIVAAEINAASGPGPQYATEFTLRNGAEVEVVESRPSWVLLTLPGTELQGWVPANAVEAITG